jgi:fibro-slime domain-containing protein
MAAALGVLICATHGTIAEGFSMPATIYDYHGDGTNPDFYKPCQGAAGGMTVSIMMESLALPNTGPNPKTMAGLLRWFLAWPQAESQVDPIISYQYTTNGTGSSQCYKEPAALIEMAHDTAFKNVTIDTTLDFTANASDYETSTGPYYPLDGKGFGNEGLPHNFYYSLNGSLYFSYKKGMSVTLSSADDAWIFIDRRLFIDRGGAHLLSPDTTRIIDNSTVPGVENTAIPGMMHNLQVFYANRGTADAYLRIKLNNFVGMVGVRNQVAHHSLFSEMRIAASKNGLELAGPFQGVRSVSLLTADGKNIATVAPNPAKRHITVPAAYRGTCVVKVESCNGTMVRKITMLR